MTEKEFDTTYEKVKVAYDRLGQLTFCERPDKSLLQAEKDIYKALYIMKPDEPNVLLTEVPLPNKKNRERIANHLKKALDDLDDYLAKYDGYQGGEPSVVETEIVGVIKYAVEIFAD